MNSKQILQNFLFMFLLFCLLFDLIQVVGKEEKTIAILYFENNSPTNTYDWLKKGLTDMLITDLSKAKEFKIIEREKIEKLTNEQALGKSGIIDEKTAQETGKILGVKYILLGSFIEMKYEIRIDVRIVDVESGEVIKAEAVQGKKEEILKLEKELAFKIAEAVGLRPGKEEQKEIVESQTTSVTAAQYNYQGVELLDQGKYEEAVVYFEKALEIDKNYIAAQKNLTKVTGKIDITKYKKKWLEEERIKEEEGKRQLQAGEKELEIVDLKVEVSREKEESEVILQSKIGRMSRVHFDSQIGYHYLSSDEYWLIVSGNIRIKPDIKKLSSSYDYIILWVTLYNKYGVKVQYKEVAISFDSPKFREHSFYKDIGAIRWDNSYYRWERLSIRYSTEGKSLPHLGSVYFMVPFKMNKNELDVTEFSVEIIYWGNKSDYANLKNKIKEKIMEKIKE